MKIGIAGFGKMGKDIFTLFFDTLQDTEFVILEVAGIEEKTAAIVKTLDKQLRRKKLTEEQYQAKKAAFQFITQAEDFAGCDIVLEAVTEDLALKQELFRRTAAVVSDNCLLLTNTSSLEIAEIFDGIPHPERCLGMHFFYPVKLAEFIELNLLPQTAPAAKERVESLVSALGRQSVAFTGDYHIYLNQFLSCTISHGMYLREYFQISVPALSDALSDLFPLAGVFELIDSIGLGLMASNQTRFHLQRNQELLQYSSRIMNGWLEEGCAPEPNSFFRFMETHETYSDKECPQAMLYMAALILNEAAYALAESGSEPKSLMNALYDNHTLGLCSPLPVLRREFGDEELKCALEQLYNKTGFACYRYAGQAAWDRIRFTENAE